MSKELEDEFNIELYPTLFFEYQNIEELTQYFCKEHMTAFEKVLQIKKKVEPLQTKTLTTMPPPKTEVLVSKTLLGKKDSLQNIIDYLKNKTKNIIKIDLNDISVDLNSMDMGMDSMHVGSMIKEIEQELKIELHHTLLFEYQNIQELAEYFAEVFKDQFQSAPPKQENNLPASKKQSPIKVEPLSDEKSNKADNIVPFQEIAVIGMAGRLAQSDNLDEFWINIEAGKDLITEIPDDNAHWDYKRWFDEDKGAPDKTYSKWGSFINDVDKFDPQFFGISPKEAIWLDPNPFEP